MDSIIFDAQIINYLTILELRVIKANNFGYYDINKKIQGYIGEIIDYVYYGGYKRTVDLDEIQSNYPAVDLANYESKVAFQITSETRTRKIYDTINSFLNLDDFQNGKLKELRFILLNNPNWSPTVWKNIEERFKEKGLPYSAETVLGLPQLEYKIKDLDNVQKSNLLRVLEDNLNTNNKDIAFLSKRDLDILQRKYSQDKFSTASSIWEVLEEDNDRKLAKIFGIDYNDLKYLDWTEEYVDNENAGSSIIYHFNIDYCKPEILKKINGLSNNSVEIFDSDFYAQKYYLS